MQKHIYQELLRYLYPGSKYGAENNFWKNSIKDYIDWYNGDKGFLFEVPSPKESEKVVAANIKDSAILTWFELHQKPKYLSDLELNAKSFKGMRVLDIGAGPMPSALCFSDIDLYSLDPLYSQYLASGYPIHYYENTKFINAYSENIPVVDDFFDVVISVNAIDHVDDLTKTSQEIKRVLRPSGKFAMHVHYHKATKTEPLELNDDKFKSLFKWCDNLKKVNETKEKMGWTLPEGQSYAIWKNF